MADMPAAPPFTESTLMQTIGLDEAELERRKRFVGLEQADLERIARIRDTIRGAVEDLAGTFFGHLATLPEARVLLGYPDLADRARTLKREHLVAMAGGVYDLAYVAQRVRLGVLYGRAGLGVNVYLGAFHRMLIRMGEVILERSGLPQAEAYAAFGALEKVACFDIGVHVDVLTFERERTIRRQSEAIRELSTPVLQIRERLLLLPLIGMIDTHRAQLITENLLAAIRSNRARVAVMDVTGVGTIDSKVANHLIQTVTAARLMGAIVVVTGISAEIAQSMVGLGIDLDAFTTVGDLQGGIEYAERLLGFEVVRAAGAHAR